MNTTKFCTLSAAIFGIACLAAAPRVVLAGGPELQKRYFALILPPETAPEDIPNLEDATAKLLVALPSDPQSPLPATINFMSSSARLSGEPATTTYECNGVTYERGESWIVSRDATFASAGGSRTLRLVWKDELPPPGAVAFAGPVLEGGQAFFFDWFWVRPGEVDDTDDPECDPHTNHYFASKKRGSNALLWCIGVALFSK